MLSSPDTLSATHQISFFGLEHGLGIHVFRPTWSCLIVKVFAALVKFLEPSSYCTIIKWVFTFHSTNGFGCFYCIMAQFKLIKHVSELDYIACSSVWLSNPTQNTSMHNLSAHQLPWYYQPQCLTSMAWTTLVMWYTCHKLAHTKI